MVMPCLLGHHAPLCLYTFALTLSVATSSMSPRSSKAKSPSNRKRRKQRTSRVKPSPRLSPDERYIAALQTSLQASSARLTLANAELNLAKAIQLTTSSDLGSSTSHESIGDLTATTENRRLCPAARALLTEDESSTRGNSTTPETRLAALLHRMAITKPKTVQCMIEGMQRGRRALRELAPTQMSLSEFQSRCAGSFDDDDDSASQQRKQGTLLYKLVWEAVENCQDTEDYYRLNFDRPTQQRFSSRTLPPFVDSYEDDQLGVLSDKYWDCESQIQRMHKLSAQPIDPGFAPETVGMLCHAFEVGAIQSPMGLNLFEVGA